MSKLTRLFGKYKKFRQMADAEIIGQGDAVTYPDFGDRLFYVESRDSVLVGRAVREAAERFPEMIFLRGRGA